MVASAILVICLTLVTVGRTIATLVVAIEVVVAVVLPTVARLDVGVLLELAVVPRLELELVAVIAMGCLADLVLALLLKQAIANPPVVDALEILRKSREHLVKKSASTLDKLHAIELVEAHIKPLNLQSSIGFYYVSLGEELRNSQHLLELM